MIQKALVYDRFLSTLGGGERYACSFAMALRDRGVETTFVSDETVPPEEVMERLRVDIAGISFTTVDPSTSGRVSELTHSTDLFVNVSYLTHYVPLSRYSLLAVHFPEPKAEEYVATGLDSDSLEGIVRLLPKHTFTGEEMWTGYEAVGLGPNTRLHLLDHEVAKGQLRLWLPDDSILATASVRIVAGPRQEHLVLTRGEVREVDLERFAEESTILLRGTRITWRQAVELSRGQSACVLAQVHPIGIDPEPAELLQARRIRATRSYDRVVANSAFTANWTERLWGVKPLVLYPAGTSNVPNSNKTRKILHIGRFFPRAEAAHYKGQIELLEAYLSMPPNLRSSWNLTFIGGAGLEAEPVLTSLAVMAEGENVTILPNAPGEVLERNLSEASIYWHATGFGGTAVAAQQEHFGITTVEAMTAGAVPIVIDMAGQREIVEHGKSGLRWTNLAELREASLRLMTSERIWKRMSDAAIERAKEFSERAFRRRFFAVLDKLETGDRD